MNAAALKVYAKSARMARRRASSTAMQTRAELYDYLGYHAYERSSTSCSGNQEGSFKNGSDHRSGPGRRPEAQEIGGALGRPRRQHRAVHRRPHAATTCTTAATTSSTSPTRPSSRRSPTCWCTASCPTRPSWPPTRPSSRPCAACPQAVKAALEAVPAAAHPMDVMRTGVSVLGTPGARRRGPRPRRRARHRRPPDGIARLDAPLLAPLLATGRRIETETDDDSIGGHFLHLLHGTRPRRVGARHAHLAHPLRRARVQRFDFHLLA